VEFEIMLTQPYPQNDPNRSGELNNKRRAPTIKMDWAGPMNQTGRTGPAIHMGRAGQTTYRCW